MENLFGGIKLMLRAYFTDSFIDSRPMTGAELAHTFGAEIIDAAIEAGFIYEHGKNQLGSPLYYISDSGRVFRDSED